MKKDYEKDGGGRKTAAGIKFCWTTELQHDNIYLRNPSRQHENDSIWPSRLWDIICALKSWNLNERCLSFPCGNVALKVFDIDALPYSSEGVETDVQPKKPFMLISVKHQDKSWNTVSGVLWNYIDFNRYYIFSNCTSFRLLCIQEVPVTTMKNIFLPRSSTCLILLVHNTQEMRGSLPHVLAKLIQLLYAKL